MNNSTEHIDYHVPAFPDEAVNFLVTDKSGTYVDVTFGGGTHSNNILKVLSNGKLISFDCDEDAQQNLPKSSNLLFIHGNFRFITNYLHYHGFQKVDGIIADLGISSHFLDDENRGFSYRFDSVLDMRMNKQQKTSARDIINSYSQEKLTHLFKEYAEINNAARVSASIVYSRTSKSIQTVSDFLSAIKSCIPKKNDFKFLAQVFQAIRIEVNEEIEVLKEFLLQTLQCLKPEGRLVVISYHSIEDRLVKNFMKSGNFEGIQEKDYYGKVLSPFNLIARKVIVPAENEIAANQRIRSAKMRIAELKTM